MPVSGSSGYRSGIVTLPNRVRIREMDSRLGLYPKIKRTGDKDRRGNDNVTPFDDRETVLFNKGVTNLLFGSLVTTGSSQSLLPYAGNNNPNGGITGTGNVIAGISDSFYMTDYKELASRKNDTENLSSFNESRIALKDTAFYMTGTIDTEYSGYSSRLHDKTQIVIDISSNEQTSVGLINKTDNTNATLDSTDVKNQLMVYYNFQSKRWEKIARGVNGNVTSGSLESLTNMVETAAIGFSNIGQVVTASSYNPTLGDTLVPDSALSHYARPVKTFGFPFHAKYVATGSQVLKMSDYISSPFLVEKIKFEFDSMKFEQGSDVYSGLQSFGSAYRYGTTKSPKFAYGLGFSIHSFFLLRQGRNRQTVNVKINNGRRHLDPVLTSSTYTANIPGDAYLTTRATPGTDTGEILTNVTSSRELITYSQLTTFFSASVNLQGFPNLTIDTFLSSSLFRDQSLRITEAGITAISDINGAEFTGSLSIESPVRITPKTPLVNALLVSCSAVGNTNGFQGLYLDDEFGGRGYGSLDSSSRALFNGQGSFKVGDEFTIAAVDGSSGNDAIETFVSADTSTIDENSPYILFPEDEIIIGYQFPLPRDLAQGMPASNTTKFTKTVFEGPAKLVLFGSQIKDNKEFHDTLNQPLTSEAIHESLHYDNPVLDQFEISTREELSGSYLDVYRDADLNITADSNITIQSLATSGNNLAGSLQRFNRLTDKTQIYYDTVVPDPLALWSLQTGRGIYVTSSGNKSLSFGVSGSAHDAELSINDVLSSGSNSDWFKSFVYNNSLGRVSFQGQKNNLKNTFLYFTDGKLSSTAFGNNADQYVASFKGFNFNAASDTITLPASLGSSDFSKAISNSLMWLYGFGAGISGSLAGSNPAGDAIYIVKERPHGYKYGVLSVIPIGRTVVYRAGQFGQYADMIEQGQDTIYLLPNNTLTESPVNIKFVARESDTTFKILNNSTIVANTNQSSNISTTATSSLPYFDDLVPRNRGIATSTSVATSETAQTITVVAED